MSNIKKLYSFIDIDNPMVAWEVAIGRIVSAQYNENNNFGLSIWQFNTLKSWLKYGYNINIVNEFKLEKYRLIRYTDYVSRLKGLYFFETEEDAKYAINYWNLDIPYSYISEVEFYYEKITKLDSEWITRYIDKENIDNDWMDAYWNGLPCSGKPLYEYLAEGIGFIKNNDLRIRAYERILEIWPYSTNLLAMAMCAFQVKNIDKIALIKPAIILNNNRIKGSFYINIENLKENENDIIEAVRICVPVQQDSYHCSISLSYSMI